jgi:Ca2+-binding RTX toxin-like protein
MTIIRGTDNSEPLTGSVDGDLMNGFSGDDVMKGLTGNDNMNGDAGNDRLFGGDGNDLLDGGLDGTAIDDKFAPDTDLLDDGAGIDTASYSQVQHLVTVNLLQGIAIGKGNVDMRWLRLSEQIFRLIGGAPAGFRLPRFAEAG